MRRPAQSTHCVPGGRQTKGTPGHFVTRGRGLAGFDSFHFSKLDVKLVLAATIQHWRGFEPCLIVCVNQTMTGGMGATLPVLQSKRHLTIDRATTIGMSMRQLATPQSLPDQQSATEGVTCIESLQFIRHHSVA